jgi:hypothetical protein
MSLFSSRKWQLDTQAYLNVCNISAALPRQQIRDFAKGVNDLGLWDSMVCWPLRSSQNYGSGTTAFSLGGLGRFDGTLVNSPTWNDDYVDFATNNTRMTTSISVAASPVAAVFVNKAEQDSGTNNIVYLTAGVNVSGRQFSLFNSGNTAFQTVLLWKDSWPPSSLAVNTSLVGVSRTSRDYVSMRVLSPTAFRGSRNSSQSGSNITVTGWDASSPASVQFGFYPENTSDNRLSFMAYFTAAIDNTADAAFYTLYKQTLGQGLGLP